MEQKLSEFRARRRREELVNKTKDTIKSVKSMFTVNFARDEKIAEDETPLLAPTEVPAAHKPPIVERQNQRERHVSFASSTSDDAWVAEPEEEETEEEARGAWLRRTNRVLLALLWVTLLVIAIKLQFGLAYALISAIVMVYVNTRTRPRREGEPSAYSVFNPNCEAIDGTLTAEQFEREIRFGPASVR